MISIYITALTQGKVCFKCFPKRNCGSLMLITSLCSENCSHPHFLDGETEAAGGEVRLGRGGSSTETLTEAAQLQALCSLPLTMPPASPQGTFKTKAGKGESELIGGSLIKKIREDTWWEWQALWRPANRRQPVATMANRMREGRADGLTGLSHSTLP